MRLTKEEVFKKWKSVNVPKEEYLKRKMANAETGENLAKSISDFNFKSLRDYAIFATILPEVLLANNPMYAHCPNGAYGTVKSSGCMNLVITYHLRRYGFDISVQEATREIANRGGRIIKFNGKTLSIPKFDLDLIKEQFPEDEEMQKVSSLKELREKYGEETGIGGSFFIFDNLIWTLLGLEGEVDLHKTRIDSLEGIMKALENGTPVPMRVSNTVYHNDEKRTGGHFVTLVGIKYGTAYVYDTSMGFNEIPFEQLMNAVKANPGLIAAWNLVDCDTIYLNS